MQISIAGRMLTVCVFGRLMDHMKQHPEMTKWVDQLTSCQHCFRQFSTSAQLQYHVENAHGPTQSSSTPSHYHTYIFTCC